MDVFADIFSTLNLKGALYFRTDFSPPWGITVPKYESVARFHIVIRGRCFFSVGKHQHIELNAGDMIMVPDGAVHSMADSQYSQELPLEKVLEDYPYDGEGVLTIGEGDPKASTQMVCGHLSFRGLANHPLLQALPDYLLLTSSCRAKEPLLDEVLRLITRRIFDQQLGAEASITRLSEIIFIELLKSELNEDERLKSILHAFHDPKISRALELIHQNPQEAWTVESLANQVAMSRSRFSHHFHELVGVAPMGYLSDWRLQKALSLLDTTRLPIQSVATQTGYRSSSAFTRAFSSKFGQTPSDYRETAQ